jgi:hypothetical protein
MKPAAYELRPARLIALATAGVLAVAAPAQAADLSGRVELSYGNVTAPADSLNAALGSPEYPELFGDIRLRWQHRWNDFSAELHYKMTVENGQGVALSDALARLAPTPAPGNYFNLTKTVTNGVDRRVTHQIDRLSFSYSTPSLVVRGGRQALTWGAGMVFHPMDLVAPFSPDTTDTEFKPGVDMLYLQWLMADGSDLEFITVPRRTVPGGPATVDASTFALRFQTTFGDLGAEMILARDHGDTTAGLGLSGALGGAAWNAEIVPTRLANGTTRTSGLANISTALTLFGRSGFGFAEYFHNGFGMPGPGLTLSGLTPELSDRLSRGQVFNVSPDYLAAGLSLELSPLVTLRGNAIYNIDDQSYLTAAEVNWSLGDNTNLIAGVQSPGGARGTEFGGLAVNVNGAPYAVPPAKVYVQFRQYF